MHWRRKWQPAPVFLPGKFHGRRSLVGCSPWGRYESDTTERLPFHFSLFMHWRRKWQPTPVFLPGESQGQGSLVGCRLWGGTELDTTEALSSKLILYEVQRICNFSWNDHKLFIVFLKLCPLNLDKPINYHYVEELRWQRVSFRGKSRVNPQGLELLGSKQSI